MINVLKKIYNRFIKNPSKVELSIVDFFLNRYNRRKILGDSKQFQSPEDKFLPNGILNRSGAISLAFKFMQGNQMKGHYFEFGSFGARTFRLAWDHSRAYINSAPHLINEIHMFAFDSFQGFPKSDLNEDIHKKFPEGLASMSQKEFVKALLDHGVNMDKVTITEGFYKESLNKNLQNKLLDNGYKNKAGVVYFDCDLYTSTTEALIFISPFLQNGTVLCFDDYYCYEGSKEKGQQLAIHHWLQSNKDFYLHPYENFGWHGKIFIFNKKN